MPNLRNRTIDDNGLVILKDNGVLEVLLTDQSLLRNVIVELSEETEEYNKWAKIFGIEKLNFISSSQIDHKINQNNWSMPKEFLDFNVEQYIIDLCKNERQVERATLELKLFKERNLLSMLKFITYLVNVMRAESVVWGVGRGSSVSSYVLFLLGLHKIDSLKYELDVSEFLK